MTRNDDIIAGGGALLSRPRCERCSARAGWRKAFLQTEADFDGKTRTWTCKRCGQVNGIEPRPRRDPRNME